MIEKIVHESMEEFFFLYIFWRHNFFSEFSYNIEIIGFQFFSSYATGLSIIRKLLEDNWKAC